MTIEQQIIELVNEYSPIARPIAQVNLHEYLLELDEHDAVIGCCRIVPTTWYSSELSHLVVVPLARRTGIARKLILQAIDCTRSAARRIITCTTHAGSASEMLFYELGFHYAEAFPGLSGKCIKMWTRAV